MGKDAGAGKVIRATGRPGHFGRGRVKTGCWKLWGHNATGGLVVRSLQQAVTGVGWTAALLYSGGRVTGQGWSGDWAGVVW